MTKKRVERIMGKCIEIFPLDKVVIDGKNICIGMGLEEVTDLLGKSEYMERYYYYNNELAIDFGADDKVEFIEFLGGYEGELQPAILGVPVFLAEADEIVELLKKNNDGAIDDSENGYSYSFLNLEVGIYRETTMESVQRDIEEMKADGVEDPEYIEEQTRKAKHWATIGFGKKGYYSGRI